MCAILIRQRGAVMSNKWMIKLSSPDSRGRGRKIAFHPSIKLRIWKVEMLSQIARKHIRFWSWTTRTTHLIRGRGNNYRWLGRLEGIIIGGLRWTLIRIQRKERRDMGSWCLREVIRVQIHDVCRTPQHLNKRWPKPIRTSIERTLFRGTVSFYQWWVIIRV